MTWRREGAGLGWGTHGFGAREGDPPGEGRPKRDFDDERGRSGARHRIEQRGEIQPGRKRNADRRADRLWEREEGSVVSGAAKGGSEKKRGDEVWGGSETRRRRGSFVVCTRCASGAFRGGCTPVRFRERGGFDSRQGISFLLRRTFRWTQRSFFYPASFALLLSFPTSCPNGKVRIICGRWALDSAELGRLRRAREGCCEGGPPCLSCTISPDMRNCLSERARARQKPFIAPRCIFGRSSVVLGRGRDIRHRAAHGKGELVPKSHLQKNISGGVTELQGVVTALERRT